MNKPDILDCEKCPLSQNGDMCPVVVQKTFQQLTGLGYDTSSDTRRGQTIIIELSARNEEVRKVNELECSLRLGALASTQSGYAPVVY